MSPPPGEVLTEEFLTPLGITVEELATDIGVSEESIRAIVEGEAEITAELSLRMARYFSTASDFWLHLQIEHDLEKVRRNIGKDIRSQITPRTAKS